MVVDGRCEHRGGAPAEHQSQVVRSSSIQRPSPHKPAGRATICIWPAKPTTPASRDLSPGPAIVGCVLYLARGSEAGLVVVCTSIGFCAPLHDFIGLPRFGNGLWCSGDLGEGSDRYEGGFAALMAEDGLGSRSLLSCNAIWSDKRTLPVASSGNATRQDRSNARDHARLG